MPREVVIPNLDDLIARYQAGEPASKLGKEVGVKGETLARHMRKRGIQIRSGRDVQRRKAAHLLPSTAELVAAYIGGESIKALSERLGVKRSRVALELRSAGVALRGRSDAERTKWGRIKAQGRDAVERQCGAAWSAARGRVRSKSEMAKSARSHMANLTRIGAWEQEIADALRAAGVSVVQQQACGIRNIDVALDECGIAVEVFGTKKPASDAKMYGERTKDLLDGGWSVAWVDCVAGCNPTAVAKHLIAMAEFFRGNPAARGGHWVVDGEAQPTSRSCLQFDHLPVVPGPNPGHE